jgi:predicted permease
MGLKRWFRRPPSPRDLREELDSHIAMRAEHDGLSDDEARRKLGRAVAIREDMRRAWIPAFWDTVAQDARYTWRAWRRSPGFAAAAIAVMALGLGSGAALFSALDRILFRPLPYPDSERLVSVGLMAPIDANEFILGSDYSNLWRTPPAPFAGVTTHHAGATACDLMDQPPERAGCLAVEHNFLRVLGARVVAGRDFTSQDDIPRAPRVALIRHSLWMRRFGGDPRAVGRTLDLDGKRVPIVGILPADFELPNLGDSEILLPQQLGIVDPRGPTGFLRAYARLKPGVTPAQAHAALDPLFQAMLQNAPAAFRKEVNLRVRPLRDRQMGHVAREAWLLLAGVGALLLIACVNVTNLLLARLAARRREFAIRAALGAGPARLARLALTEGALLALAGGALGLLLAAALLRIFITMAPASIPKIEQASLDLRVVALSLGASLVCGALIGFWPALSIRAAAFRGPAQSGARIRFMLATAQIAVTIAMLGSAALLLRSLWNLTSAALGFETDTVLTASITLNAAKYSTRERQMAFFEDLLDRAARTPGAEDAALSDSLPPASQTRAMIFSRLEIEGRPLPREGTGGMVPWRLVTPRYFETLRIRIVQGRGFVESDRHAAEPAMILNELLAKRLFPGQDALGKRIRPHGSPQSPWHVVVGVAGNVRDFGPAANIEPEYYVVRRANPADAGRSAFLAVRYPAGTSAAAAFLREAVGAADPQLPVQIQPMRARVSSLSDQARFTAWLLAAFAALALVVAAAGLAGVASYVVTQRAREIGIRMALGATPARVVRQTLGQTALWVIAGASLGFALAWIAARFLRALLFGITAADPAAWSLALLLLGLALLAAVLRPALRAARVDPAVALRSE